jgi:hypothetical protein
MKSEDNHPVTPERAVQILKENNVKVTREQAEKIL